MRISPLVLAASCCVLSCSNDATKPQPSSSATSSSATSSSATSTASSATDASAAATDGGNRRRGKGRGKGGNRDEKNRDYEKVSKKRQSADWPKTGRYERTLEHGGMTRRYLVQIPPTHRPERKAPLLIMLHGSGGTPEQYARRKLGISEMAALNAWVAVFPQGSQKHPEEDGYQWRHGLCVAEGAEKGDEVGFFRALLDQLEKDLLVDTRRIYVMGFSSGGHMTQVLGSELGDRLAAIVSIAGMSICQLDGKEEERIAPPKEPMNALMFFGKTDPGLPIEGGPTTKSDGKMSTGSLEAMTKIWTDAAQCGKPDKKGKDTDGAITIDYQCDKTGKHVLSVILNKYGSEIPKKVGRKKSMSFISRFLEGTFREKE